MKKYGEFIRVNKHKNVIYMFNKNILLFYIMFLKLYTIIPNKSFIVSGKYNARMFWSIVKPTLGWVLFNDFWIVYIYIILSRI
jgi:hypothetical protein